MRSQKCLIGATVDNEDELSILRANVLKIVAIAERHVADVPWSQIERAAPPLGAKHRHPHAT